MATAPWYRHPWVWALILIPATAVIAGFVTLWLAIRSDDGLVVDDYYVRGKEVNRTLERDRAAGRLGLAATIEFDPAGHQVTARLTVTEPGYTLPDRATLQLLHATRDGYDQTLVLERDTDGRYRSTVAKLAPGRWHLQLEADDWRLLGSMMVPGTGMVQIDAAPIK